MKIEIELVDSVQAKITIEGKEMDYILIGLRAGLHPLTDTERNETIGGLVASKLCEVLASILQGHIPDDESPDDDCWETWEPLSSSTLAQVEKTMRKF